MNNIETMIRDFVKTIKKHNLCRETYTKFKNEEKKRIFIEGELMKSIHENSFLKQEIKDLTKYQKYIDEKNKEIDEETNIRMKNC